MELNNGIEMPQLGIGTYTISPEDAKNSVREALKIGYRLIDTANAYVNERAVGRGIQESNVPREEIFVSSKLWVSEYDNENAVDETLERLGLDYIDLLFIHQPSGNYLKGYEKLVRAYKEGKIRAIGISNFEGKYLDEILEKFDIVPQVIQVEAHPYYPQEELQRKILEEGIKLMSWYPLGHGDSNLLNEEILKRLASKYNKTTAQIILRWHIQKGFIVIPGSKNIEHIKENFNIMDFSLTDEEMNEIASLNKNERYYTRTENDLQRFASWKPTFEQK